MRLFDVIEALKDTYNSIDVRIFSFMQDNVWKNIFTIIRFRQESVLELEKLHKQLIDQCNGLIQTSEFRVGLFQFPIENWTTITDQMSKQFLCLSDNFAVNYFHPVHFNDSVREPYLDRNIEHVLKNWKIFRGYNETSNSSRPNYDKLFDVVLEKKFTHFDDYLSALFQFDRYDFQRNPWVNTFVPIFFKINEIIFDHDKVTVKFTTFIHENLELTFNFFTTERNFSNGEFITKKTKNLEPMKNNESHQYEVSIPLDTKSLGSDFELLVTKNNNILIDSMHDKINNHWKDNSEFSNPFNFVFQKYVSYDELEKMLIECESVDFKDPSKAFERGVSWLLNLLGIQNIILGGYEKITKGSNFVSTDILANLTTNNLLLINATVGFPKQSDFDREKEFRENLLKFLKNKDLELKTIYFTNKEPTESEVAAKSNDVILIGRSKIQIVVNHLKKGEISDAKKIIENHTGF